MKGEFAVYSDADIFGLTSKEDIMDEVVGEVEEFFRDKRKGQVVSPARFTCEATDGRLVVTAGASEHKRLIGLRAYSTFGEGGADPQVTVIYQMDGSLRGIFVGEEIGRIRTAAINAVAVKHLSRHDSTVLAVVGSGRQARSVVPYIARVRQLERIYVSSLHPSHAKSYSESIGASLAGTGIDISVAESAESAVSKADIVLTATTSSSPVIRSAWVRSGQHISSMGHKFRESHEIEPDLVRDADIVASDSVQQLKSYGPLFFVDERSRERIIDLAELIDGSGRSDEDVSLFLSVGLAGTEVVVAGKIISKLEDCQNGAERNEMNTLG